MEKHSGEGKVVRFKSRLVTKGYSQRHGNDFEETFSPVVRFSSIQTLLALGIQKDMIVHQMDVVTAFFNGELYEEIYMQQPDGYQVSGKENLVCRLKKSLYRLKQAPSTGGSRGTSLSSVELPRIMPTKYRRLRIDT